ncbi:hypothetical protein [Beggiatoa leptomitoformis]|uniref:Uncharacterized protein n=1 Tax=Beggiatoa leptomitoformis TaxID=288004 RepID=A0A2N9YFE1_9GAMM|nr:hypothetical protein [Beggiatoa leptomitoformis]ALG68472.1 hypothetical protein AL038_13145 [Beggiatoa leptomitoformis]AUI69194.1 hypothetical protein BLE401_11120 [Beggiatoa leptomitoformis]
MHKDKIVVPVLKDIVVAGREVKNVLPPMLNEAQVKAFQQQMEDIIQARLQTTLQKAGGNALSEITLKKITKEAVQDIKTYLDKKLPILIKAIAQPTGKK